ncbi:MAG: class I SAM-dependent methyltransferase [Burkholderiaceae bacterium]
MTNIREPGQAPDRKAALAQYRRRASVYDFEMALFEPIRRDAICELALRPGDTVLDVGCGTGLSFALLQQGLGTKGRIVGIEQCPEMMQQAQQRVAQQGWDNVTLLCSPVELAEIPVKADAALFHFTHDILRRPEAIANVMQHLKSGAHVVASGLKWAPPWAWPVNLFVLPAAAHSVTSFEGLGQPWDKLSAWIGDLSVQTTLMGSVYIASGVLERASGPGRSSSSR